MDQRARSASFVDPPLWRVILAFIVSPAAVLGPHALMLWVRDLIGLGGVADIPINILLFIATTAYPVMLFFGVPAYYLFRNRILRSIRVCMIFMTSMICIALAADILFARTLTADLQAISYFVGEALFFPTVILIFAVPTAFVGLVSGLVFGLILNVGAKPPLAGEPDAA